MKKNVYAILALNIGSTSTKIALFINKDLQYYENLFWKKPSTSGRRDEKSALDSRRKDVKTFIAKHKIALKEINVIVSRGGLMRPLPSGIYEVNESMCQDLVSGRYGKHPSALGPVLSRDLRDEYNLDIKCLVVDPPSTDELEPIARISGIPHINRKSAFHALNQKASARIVAERLGKDYHNLNLIVAHLGGGITIGAHRKGKVIDCTHGLSEGPFTPERAGSLPTLEILQLMDFFPGDIKSLKRGLVGEGGLSAYLGTCSAEEVEKKIAGGDKKAALLYKAMAYQIAKDIGAMAAVLKGKVDATVLTGGLANSGKLIRWVKERVCYIAPVYLCPGENEMLALAMGGLRALRKEEAIRKY